MISVRVIPLCLLSKRLAVQHPEKSIKGLRLPNCQGSAHDSASPEPLSRWAEPAPDHRCEGIRTQAQHELLRDMKCVSAGLSFTASRRTPRNSPPIGGVASRSSGRQVCNIELYKHGLVITDPATKVVATHINTFLEKIHDCTHPTPRPAPHPTAPAT